MPDFFIHKRRDKILIEARTLAAIKWMFRKMSVSAGQREVLVEAEHLEEFVDLIQEDDLSVEVR